MIICIHVPPNEVRKVGLRKTPSGWCVEQTATWYEKWSSVTQRRYVKTYEKALEVHRQWTLEELRRRNLPVPTGPRTAGTPRITGGPLACSGCVSTAS